MTLFTGSMADFLLWQRVQRIVYPDRRPSRHQPFPARECSSKNKPASWLYHTLLADADLRAKFFHKSQR